MPSEYAFKHVHALFAHELKTSSPSRDACAWHPLLPRTLLLKTHDQRKGERVTFALAPAAPIGKVNKGKLEDGRNLKANSKIRANDHRSADDNDNNHDKAGLDGKQDVFGKPMANVINSPG